MDLSQFEPSLSLSSVLLGCLGLWIFWWLFDRLTNPLQKIPGPTSLPIIGSILSIDSKKPHISFSEMAEKYGDIFKVRIFNQVWVVVAGYDFTYEALVRRSQEFAGRPISARISLALGEDVVFTEGADHTRRKKLFLSTMKNYGSGLDEMEQLLSHQTQRFINHIEASVGQTTNMAEQFKLFTCSVVCTLVYNKELCYDDPMVLAIFNFTDKITELISPTKDRVELDSFPWLLRIPIIKDFYLQKFKSLEQLRQPLLDDRIHKKLNSSDDSAHGDQSGMLAKLVKAAKTGESSSDGAPEFTAEELVGILTDIVSAGVETTSRTMTHLFLELCKNPEIRRGLQSEIDRVIGRDRAPQLADRVNMPFTEAVLDETHRLLTVAPVLPHKTTTDVVLGGYHLPKDTVVMVNVWPAHHDEDVYPDPFQFKPERFLDARGQRIARDDIKRKRLQAFGGGRRVCPGETFAKSRLFLLLVSLYQRLDFELCNPDINCDVRSYDNEQALDVPDVVMAKVLCRN